MKITYMNNIIYQKKITLINKFNPRCSSLFLQLKQFAQFEFNSSYWIAKLFDQSRLWATNSNNKKKLYEKLEQKIQNFLKHEKVIPPEDGVVLYSSHLLIWFNSVDICPSHGWNTIDWIKWERHFLNYMYVHIYITYIK